MTAMYLPAGSVIDWRQDHLPTSGDHLDIRIMPRYGENSGTRINPSLRPRLLDRVYIGEGEGRRGLRSFPLTSGWGPRNTGIAGASTFHKGHDYGIAAGMPISVQGGQRYWTENGVGIVALNDDQGNPYELEFYHTRTGDPSEAAPSAPGIPSGDSSPARSYAKVKAQAYKDMSASQINAEYDKLRAMNDVETAESEGMKMHKAFFNKP